MFNKINHTKNQSEYFDKLVGNIPQMYSPYSNNIYKSSYNTSFYNKNDIDKTYNLNKNYNSGPSIPEYTLNIPLLFTFFRNNNNLPIISLKNTEVFEFLKKLEIYILLLKIKYALINPVQSLRNFETDNLEKI